MARTAITMRANGSLAEQVRNMRIVREQELGVPLEVTAITLKPVAFEPVEVYDVFVSFKMVGSRYG